MVISITSIQRTALEIDRTEKVTLKYFVMVASLGVGVTLYTSDIDERQWAISHLRKIWHDLKDHQLPEFKQLNKPCWGTNGSYVRSGPLSALAEEMETRFDSLMDVAMNPEDEEGGSSDAVIDNRIGALLTAEHQLTRTIPVDDEEEVVPGSADEDKNENADDDNIV